MLLREGEGGRDVARGQGTAFDAAAIADEAGLCPVVEAECTSEVDGHWDGDAGFLVMTTGPHGDGHHDTVPLELLLQMRC